MGQGGAAVEGLRRRRQIRRRRLHQRRDRPRLLQGASFKGAKFNNAVLSGTNLGEADLENTDFTEAYLGDFDQRKLCKNPRPARVHARGMYSYYWNRPSDCALMASAALAQTRSGLCGRPQQLLALGSEVL